MTPRRRSPWWWGARIDSEILCGKQYSGVRLRPRRFTSGCGATWRLKTMIRTMNVGGRGMPGQMGMRKSRREKAHAGTKWPSHCHWERRTG